MPRAQNVTLIRGYHPNTPIPDRAVAAGLKHRFAIVFHTERVNVDHMYFDAMLFCDMIKELALHIIHDEVKIELDRATVLNSLDKLSARYQETEQGDRYPPQRIEFLRSRQLSCLEETEFWALCGGPQPYSDSYTASFFTRVDRSSNFLQACYDVCAPAKPSIVEASENIVELALWKRLWKRVFV